MQGWPVRCSQNHVYRGLLAIASDNGRDSLASGGCGSDCDIGRVGGNLPACQSLSTSCAAQPVVMREIAKCALQKDTSSSYGGRVGEGTLRRGGHFFPQDIDQGGDHRNDH
jgi:hypothetical protein